MRPAATALHHSAARTRVALDLIEQMADEFADTAFAFDAAQTLTVDLIFGEDVSSQYAPALCPRL